MTEYRRKYKRLYAKGLRIPIRYIAEKDGVIKTFETRKEIAKFFGYCEDSITRKLRGYKIERYKWWEDVEVTKESENK